MTTIESERKVKFVIFWERRANSGVFETMAADHHEAIKNLGYHPAWCKMTCYQVNGEKMVIGSAN